MKIHLFYSLLLLLYLPVITVVQATPNTLVLAPNTPLVNDPPSSYTVSAGDTVVDVLARFVRDPLITVQRWQSPPQLRVGDRVSLVPRNQQLTLQIQRGRLVKLSPEVRIVPKQRGIPVIPRENVQQFLSRPKVISLEELELAGYIIDTAEQRLLISNGQTIYVRGIEEDVLEDNLRYSIIRQGQTYTNPEDGEVLAYEAIYLGDAELIKADDPASMTIINNVNAIEIGDRLVPLGARNFNEDFIPSVPVELEDAQIIAVVDGVSEIGQYQVVVINRGIEDDIAMGNILAVQKGGKWIKDPVTNEDVLLPNEKAATLLVFKPYDRISYALVMRASRTLNINDKVTLP